MASCRRLLPLLTLLSLGTAGSAGAQPLTLASGAESPPAQPGAHDNGTVLQRPVTLDLEGAPLQAAIEEIASRAGIPLAYRPGLLPADRRVSLRAERIPAGEAFRSVLAGTPLAVRVGPAGHLSLVASQPGSTRAEALVGTISGRVVDASTQGPLAGANVVVAGTQRGTLTDSDGRFLLTGIAAGTHQVRASMIGYGAQEQTVTVQDGQMASLTFSLQPSAVELEGLVVVGYTAQQRKNVSQSTSYS